MKTGLRSLRSRVSKYPMAQRRTIRTQLKNPSLNVSGKYSGLMRFASTKTKPSKWKPSSKFKSNVKKVVVNKTVQKTIFTAATV